MPLFAPPDLKTLEARRDVKGLTKLLRHDKFSVSRRDAAKILGEFGDPRALQKLCEALRDPDGQVREAAAEALGKLGDSRAFEPLMAALQDARGSMWHPAVTALGKLRDPRAFDPLLRMVRNPPAGRGLWIAIEALGDLGDTRAVPFLVPYLRDARVGTHAARALDRLGWRPQDGETAALYAVAKGDWGECVRIGAAAVGPLIAVLDSRFVGIQEDAARTLGRIGERWAVEPLASMLHDEKARAIRAAADALDTLHWDPVGHEAEAAYRAIRHDWARCVELGAAAVDPLIAMIHDDDHPVSVQREAAVTLVEMYHSGGLDPASRQKILAQRPTITYRRSDDDDDWDDERFGKPPPLGEDRSLGVDFPL